MVAGTHSGAGKTTVATGLMAALRRRGTTVSSAKVGPDFIDPGYHHLATGRAGRNLDAFICGDEAMVPLAARAGAGSDVLVVEGVMGLFDGVGAGTRGSTAAVAAALGAPVVLVVDASAMSGSVAALVHGYDTFLPGLRLGGVICNRVGGSGHETLLRQALEPLGVPVLGILRRDDALVWRDRHLGLVPVAEDPFAIRRALDRLADAVAAGIDIEAVASLAASADAIAAATLAPARPSGRARVAVVGGPAFSFTYPDNLERLTEAGAELVPVDPAVDRTLPEGTTGLVVGGGFPEVYVEALAANRPLLAEVGRRVRAGLVTWAECGGLLWLARSLDGQPMCAAVDATGTMTHHLTLGYRTATVTVDTPVAPAGTTLRGHEFHYSVVEPPGTALTLRGRHGSAGGGFGSSNLLASYLHLHLGADPAPAERFVAAASARSNHASHATSGGRHTS